MNVRSDSARLAQLPRLERMYWETVVPTIQKDKSYSTAMRVPRLVKIVLNMGVGGAVADKKLLQSAMDDMLRIGGQKPVATLARKSIAGFKIRKEYPIGCKVTLRRHRMYDFLDRLITTALPRSRDFRGLSARAFDGNGNYSLGVREQIIFHEIHYENVDSMRGMDITIETTAKNDEEARELLTHLGLPLRTL